MCAEYVVEIRYWVDLDGKRFPQYRARGSSSLVWVPMGRLAAEQAIVTGRFLGHNVEAVPDVVRGSETA